MNTIEQRLLDIEIKSKYEAIESTKERLHICVDKMYNKKFIEKVLHPFEHSFEKFQIGFLKERLVIMQIELSDLETKLK